MRNYFGIDDLARVNLLRCEIL